MTARLQVDSHRLPRIGPELPPEVEGEDLHQTRVALALRRGGDVEEPRRAKERRAGLAACGGNEPHGGGSGPCGGAGNAPRKCVCDVALVPGKSFVAPVARECDC